MSCLGGVVVSVLATGSKGCRFKPDQGNGFLRAIKIHRTPSFKWEVKPEVPYRKIFTACKRFPEVPQGWID
jgi:predicted Ser/Thr protein kinase